MAIAERPHFEAIGFTSGTAFSEAVGGVAAVVLTILGLANVVPALLVAIATIVVGVAVIFQGASIISEYTRLLPRAGEAAVAADGGESGMITIEFLAGAAGIVLGILALIGIHPVTLVAIAVIVFGGALILSGGSAASVAKAETARLEQAGQRFLGGGVAGSIGIQALAGLAAIVLGILALVGISATPLVLIALLTLGAVILLSGSTLTGLMVTLLRETP